MTGRRTHRIHPQLDFKRPQIFTKRKRRLRRYIRTEIDVIVDDVNVLVVYLCILYILLVIARNLPLFRGLPIPVFEIHI
jgi:hypothetical protein